jgi:chemosensory pili system protein ChpB (putative protein-glutamate methylesterase)
VVAVIKSHKLGIIAENSADIHTLRKVGAEAGMEVSSTVEFSRWSPDQPLKGDIDAWVVNLDVEALERTCPEKLDALIDAIPGLMILCEGGSPPSPVAEEYANWSRRLLGKLQDISGSLNLAKDKNGAPERVWVLAGSIGGPDAIHRFLVMLPPGLDIAFVYANHLQADFDQVLANAVEKNTHYPAYVLQHGDVLAINKVAVVSPEFITTIKSNGTVQVSQQRWQGQYRPNLDHVVSSVAGTFGHTGGVIIFSGMCDDGAASCRIMKQNGGKVWAQRSDTCVSSAMTDAALATGCVELTGSPEDLAWQLMQWANETSRLKNKR